MPIGFLPAFAIDGPLTRSGSGDLAVIDHPPFQEPAYPGHIQWSAGAQGAWSGAASLSEVEARRIRVDPGAAPGSDGPGVDVELTARRQDETQQLRPWGP